MQPGLADDDDRVGHRPTARIASTLRSRIVARQLGLQRAYAPPAPQHSPSSSVSTTVVRAARARCGRRGAPAGRGGGGTGPARRPCGPSRTGSGRLRVEPLREVARRVPRTLGPRACRAGGRSPSSPRRSPALSTTIGRVAGHRRDRRAARGAAPRRRGPRARAARRSSRPRGRATRCGRAGGAHHACSRPVGVAHPRVHHAAGEQLRVAGSPTARTSSGVRKLGGVDARQPEPLRHEVQPLRDEQHHVSAMQHAGVGPARRGTRPTRPAGAAASGAAPRSWSAARVCLPSGDRTAPTTGTRLRSRGTARIRPSRVTNASSIGAPCDARPRASPRCARAATRSPARSRGRSGSAAGTTRTRRTRRARRRRARARACADTHGVPGVTTAAGPGRELARSGSKASLMRCMSVAFGSGRPKPSSPSPPASRSSQPPCACATRARAGEPPTRRRRRRARCRRRAPRDQRAAGVVEVGARAPSTTRRARPRSGRGAGPSGSDGRGRSRSMRRGLAPSTSAAYPSSRTWYVVTVPRASPRAGTRRAARRRRSRNHCDHARRESRPAAQRQLDEHAERAERADERAAARS